jgi:hypothetical protein
MKTRQLKTAAGELPLEAVGPIFNALPIDITFIDGSDAVRFYAPAEGRIFPRSPAVIGRKVQQCHPEKSLSVVNKILSDFKSGARNVAEFWISLQGKVILIRYFAVRGKKGKYLGTLEVSQDITRIQKLEGEKRLLDDAQ